MTRWKELLLQLENAAHRTVNAANRWGEMAPIRETRYSSSLLESRHGHSLTRRERPGVCALPRRVSVCTTPVCTSARTSCRMK